MCKEKRVVICKLILSVEGFCMYLAKLLANAESVIWKKTKVSGSSLDQKWYWHTLGPQMGMRPLHLVLAFWSMALSHSSLPLASLQGAGRKRERERERERERGRGVNTLASSQLTSQLKSGSHSEQH